MLRGIVAAVMIAMVMGATQASAFPAGLQPGVAPGETWVVCQGYNNTSISHNGNLQYSLDLTSNLSGVGSIGCTGDANATANRVVGAPGDGSVAWNDGSGFCVNFDAGGSMKLYHVSGLAAGSRVSAGQAVGRVFAAGLAGNGGYAHLHIAVYNGGGCIAGNRTTFSGGARIGCGAPDMSTSGAFNQWSGTRLTGGSCAPPPPPPPPPPASESDVIRNGSFEDNAAAWAKAAFSDQVNIAAYVNRPYAEDGDHYLEANTLVSGGSVSQDIAVPGGDANRSYTLSMWVRKAPGTSGAPSGTLVLWDLGAGPRNSQTAVALTDRWQLVSAPITIAGAGATTLRAEFYMGTTGVNYDFDGAQLVRAGLSDASFESAGAGWTKKNLAGQVNIAPYNNPAFAREGSWYLEANTAAGGGSFGQDVSVPSGAAGRSYTFSIWVRRAPGSPVGASGTLVLWDLNAGPRSYSTGFTLSDTWTLVSVPMWIQGTGATTLRPEVYMGTAGVNFDFDGAQLARTGLLNASFEQGTPGWSKIGAASSVNVAGYTNQGYAKEGAGYLEANTAVGGGSIAQDAGVPAGPAGRTYVYSVWMRKAPATSGSPSGTLALWDLNGGPVSGMTNFTLTDKWQMVSAPVSVVGSGASTLRAEAYMSTTAVNYDFDGATLASGNQAELYIPPPAPPSLPAPSGPTTGGGVTPGNGQSTAPGGSTSPPSAVISKPVSAGPLTVTTMRAIGRRLIIHARLSRPGVLSVRLIRSTGTIRVTSLRVRSARRVSVSWNLPARFRRGRFSLVVSFSPTGGAARTITRTVRLG